MPQLIQTRPTYQLYNLQEFSRQGASSAPRASDGCSRGLVFHQKSLDKGSLFSRKKILRTRRRAYFTKNLKISRNWGRKSLGGKKKTVGKYWLQFCQQIPVKMTVNCKNILIITLWKYIFGMLLHSLVMFTE